MKRSIFLSLIALIFALIIPMPADAAEGNTVIIDPGHGGKFSGTTGFSGNSTGYYEKHANLEVALKLREELINRGYTVYMTRDNDRDFGSTQAKDLAKRMKIANNLVEGNRDNSIFISVHHNAIPGNPSFRGYETYFYDINDGINPTYPPDPLQEHYSPESKRLAHTIHNTVLDEVPITEGRGIISNSLFVTRNAQMPSTLVELGYMTNPTEEKLIKTSKFQREAASSISNAIDQYFDVYEIYDNEDNRLGIYESKQEALDKAKTIKGVYVLEKSTQNIIYNNIEYRYGVYHSSVDTINQTFITAEAAVDFAKGWNNTRVVDNKESRIIWSNYLAENYTVEHSAQGTLEKFYQADPAIAYAKKWKNTAVINIENDKVLWTNYLTKEFKVEHTTKGLLKEFYREQHAIDYAENWMNTTVTNKKTNEVVWSNQDENYVYDFKTKKVSSDHRITTAIEVSKDLYPEGFSSNHSHKTVVLTTMLEYADALSSAPLAAQEGNAPILLTDATKIREEVLAELNRLNTEKVILIGGTQAISTQIEQNLKSQGYAVERISGKDRFETNLEINKQLTGVEGVFVTSGMNFPDTLGAAPIAAIKDWAIVLTRTDRIPDNSLNYLNFEDIVIVGGTQAVSTDVEDEIITQNGGDKVLRLSGSDRYKTLAAVLSYFKDDIHSNEALVATGKNFPDALTASSLSVKSKAPLLLTGDKLDPELSGIIESYGDNNVVEEFKVIGGVLNDQLINQIANLIK
ncbi:hypothetical protein CIL05_01230 [Virgibacillus profundi]|uniref:MurNAc-LAA domain-containing protein n=1 Tax=Virgibacillus profundi TaxID=2024555 RepID=A0A2A2IJL6_9BACI|nr:cell wall-binding repeat-containing protein [Virgibacillus profundi]PAV31303.1 hypothetical protein CIL05_01230 [Virgibacillus profundi]PXY55488.1 hypothetical protein CIT14_01235 [Virgibacillus profundi]